MLIICTNPVYNRGVASFLQLVGTLKGVWGLSPQRPKASSDLKEQNTRSKVYSRKTIKTIILNYEFN
jgi:hypothetical protein